MIEIIKVFQLGYVHTIPQQHTATDRNWNQLFTHIAFVPNQLAVRV